MARKAATGGGAGGGHQTILSMDVPESSPESNFRGDLTSNLDHNSFAAG